MFNQLIKAMTSKQLESLEPQQARAVSAAYSSSLTVDQTDSLQAASADDLGGEATAPSVAPSAASDSKLICQNVLL